MYIVIIKYELYTIYSPIKRSCGDPGGKARVLGSVSAAKICENGNWPLLYSVVSRCLPLSPITNSCRFSGTIL